MIAKRVYLIFISILATIFPAIAQHILYTELPTQDQLPTAPIYRAICGMEPEVVVFAAMTDIPLKYSVRISKLLIC